MTEKENQDVWDSALSLLSDNLIDFAVLLALFALTVFIVTFAFGAAASYFRPAFLASGVIYSFMVIWFISTLYCSLDWVKESGYIDYVDTIMKGLRRAVSDRRLLLIVLALGFVAGLIAVTGVPLTGLLVALYSGIALVGVGNPANVNFFGAFIDIGTKSRVAGTYLFATVLVVMIPLVHIVQFFMLPIAVAIISKRGK